MKNSNLQPILWENGRLQLLDQRLVPGRKVYLACNDLHSVIEAIRSMATRGAPAIAISGAFGLVMEMRNRFLQLESDSRESSENSQKNHAKPDYDFFLNSCHRLKESRPTAVNLSRMLVDIQSIITREFWNTTSSQAIVNRLERFAIGEFERDIQANRAIGASSLPLFEGKDNLHIITHCNTGALATAGHGTALGIIRTLHNSGKRVHVYADETRPYLQGSRLTAFEMREEGIPCNIITDGMSSWLMNDRKIDAVIVGCDRIARNGDTANKIGTCNLAIIAKEFHVPFYVAATKDSFDPSIASGREIPIEMRDESEVTTMSFLRDAEGNPVIPKGTIAPEGINALNPGFDVTPAQYITRVITEEGIFLPGELPPSLHFQ